MNSTLANKYLPIFALDNTVSKLVPVTPRVTVKIVGLFIVKIPI
ncbi:hypothetical protein J2S16_002262 [Cytobacillus kochii]|nr:hypothetical protein [Cytobacillus kochii]